MRTLAFPDIGELGAFSEFISDTIWWNRYHKAQKEIKIMKEEVERYE